MALLLLHTGMAAAQLPLLDTLSRDPTDDSAYAKLPWDALTVFPVSCDPGYCVIGVVEGALVNTWDCGPCSAAPTPTPCHCDNLCATDPSACATPTP